MKTELVGELMGMHLFDDDIMFLQRLLKTAGLYEGKIDGIFGPKTDAAVNRMESVSSQIGDELGRFDSRTEKSLLTLQPKAQRIARSFMRKLADAHFNVRIISGTRSYAEQDTLFQKGRFGNPGSIVTKARGGQSNHNFGLAWDIGLFSQDGSYLPESPLYDEAPTVVRSPELEWGGNWTGFKDRVHYQLATGKTIATLRSEFENGIALV